MNMPIGIKQIKAMKTEKKSKFFHLAYVYIH